uniref:Uncharacterized protein n=2 Tax=Physcomitrium patens TaxID=3218 RepID=A0A7I4BVT6_PHYPA
MQEQNDRTCAHSTSCSQCCFDCLFEIFHSCWCHNDIVILLLGLNNAGKSTLLSTIRKEERKDHFSTWGFDGKVWKTHKFRTMVYDLGGRKSFRGIWPHYYAEAFGVIFVVDGADESRIWEASVELKAVMEHPYLVGKPLLIVANKLNESKALKYDDLKGALGPFNASEHAFIYCDCRLQSGCLIDKELQVGLDWLVASIELHYNQLEGRVEYELAKQDEKELAKNLQSTVLSTNEDIKCESHEQMQTQIELDETNLNICTYERKSMHGQSFNISTAEYEKSLAPLIESFKKTDDEPSYTPTQIAEYFGICLNKTQNIECHPQHLPGQLNLGVD